MFNSRKPLSKHQLPTVRDPAQGGTGRGSTVLSSILETAQVIAVSLVIVLIVKYYLVQPFLVKGASMEPNFHDGNYLVIDELTYRIRPPERGEVIVFKYPRDPREYFIKRIVGLPNERVEIKDQKLKIYNNDHPSGLEINEQPYLENNIPTKGNITVQLGSGEYFVLGDNRPQSSDSRYWGSVPDNLIVGRVWFRVWVIEKVVDGVKVLLS